MRNSYSLIVCCYNSEKVIGPTIAAINALVHSQSDNIELIVVDNNCSDNTVSQIKSAWSNDDIRLRIISEYTPGLMNARRKGVSQAENDIVVFIDDDNIIDADALSVLDNIYSENTEIGCVGGKVLPFQSYIYPDWFERYKAVYACGEQAETSMDVSKSRMTLFGAGLSFRRDVIQAIFNDRFPLVLSGRTGNSLLRGDDSELCMRCLMYGYHNYYSDRLVLQHNILPERVSWDYVQKARYGGGMAETILSIYRSINMGREPRNYLTHAASVFNQWRQLLRKPGIFNKIREQGSRESFDYRYLLGLTRGLIMFHPLRYARIRKALLHLAMGNRRV